MRTLESCRAFFLQAGRTCKGGGATWIMAADAFLRTLVWEGRIRAPANLTSTLRTSHSLENLRTAPSYDITYSIHSPALAPPVQSTLPEWTGA